MRDSREGNHNVVQRKALEKFSKSKKQLFLENKNTLEE